METRTASRAAGPLAVVLEEGVALWHGLAANPAADPSQALHRIRRLLGAADRLGRAFGVVPERDLNGMGGLGAGRADGIASSADAARRAVGGFGTLSAREREVLGLVANGCRDRVIAEALGISPRTVTSHVTSIFNKLGVDNRTAAAAEAMRRGLI